MQGAHARAYVARVDRRLRPVREKHSRRPVVVLCVEEGARPRAGRFAAAAATPHDDRRALFQRGDGVRRPSLARDHLAGGQVRGPPASLGDHGGGEPVGAVGQVREPVGVAAPPVAVQGVDLLADGGRLLRRPRQAQRAERHEGHRVVLRLHAPAPVRLAAEDDGAAVVHGLVVRLHRDVLALRELRVVGALGPQNLLGQRPPRHASEVDAQQPPERLQDRRHVVVAPQPQHAQGHRPALSQLPQLQLALRAAVEADEPPLARRSERDAVLEGAPAVEHVRVPAEQSLPLGHVVRLRRHVVPSDLAAARPPPLAAAQVHLVLLAVLLLHHRLEPPAGHGEDLVAGAERHVGRRAPREQRHHDALRPRAPPRAILPLVELAVAVGVAAALAALGVDRDEQGRPRLPRQGVLEHRGQRLVVDAQHEVARPDPGVLGDRPRRDHHDAVVVVEAEAEDAVSPLEHAHDEGALRPRPPQRGVAVANGLTLRGGRGHPAGGRQPARLRRHAHQRARLERADEVGRRRRRRRGRELGGGHPAGGASDEGDGEGAVVGELGDRAALEPSGRDEHAVRALAARAHERERRAEGLAPAVAHDGHLAALWPGHDRALARLVGVQHHDRLAGEQRGRARHRAGQRVLRDDARRPNRSDELAAADHDPNAPVVAVDRRGARAAADPRAPDRVQARADADRRPAAQRARAHHWRAQLGERQLPRRAGRGGLLQLDLASLVLEDASYRGVDVQAGRATLARRHEHRRVHSERVL